MSCAIHDHCLSAAEPLSDALHAAMAAAGPIEFSVRRDLAFPVYLARAVTGQQLSVAAARTIWARVEESAQGAPLMESFRPERSEALRACGLSGAKTRTVCAIAEAARDGLLEVHALAPLSPEARAERLTSIWGVGQWTADMMNMFYFGETDIWPDGDVAARKTLERLTSPRRKTVRTAARFAPYRSYLALYMWRHVDAPPT
ncbi:MAG: DNA-3-methyladenine glycosylase 2 family protein [Pseudomonadota bacterium]